MSATLRRSSSWRSRHRHCTDEIAGGKWIQTKAAIRYIGPYVQIVQAEGYLDRRKSLRRVSTPEPIWCIVSEIAIAK
jgi:hypothetical protein